MCGIFSIVSKNKIDLGNLKILASHAETRGKDSSGLVYDYREAYRILRADYKLTNLLKQSDANFSEISCIMGHSRLVTNGMSNNQPVERDGMLVLHNGIIVNADDIWPKLSVVRNYEIDTEIILGLAIEYLNKDYPVEDLPDYIISNCKGTVSALLLIPNRGLMLAFSNNGSLYSGNLDSVTYISSEKYPLEKIGCRDIYQILNDKLVLNIPKKDKIVNYKEISSKSIDLVPAFKNISAEEKLLKFSIPNLKRCTRCILPETMPYIEFNSDGVCNYCENYKIRNKPKPKEELFNLIQPYRRKSGQDCIVPFSGGRDSCYGLHLVVNELKMKPITYTYDWGMVTDLGRRNISRMCAELGVENIIVADDISKKRRNIAMNLKAWLKSPHLGMISILTAGDKHFFKHVETVKKQTGINLNLWGVNPLEVTHFKAGFLGVKPDFAEQQVYMRGLRKQLNYQNLRFRAMLKSPGYFNSSLWDTLSGEYYRSFADKKDYFHIFDYWQWEEKIVEDTLMLYGWELAPDTKATWRIGDGTAAFYNYIYYTVAGFSEHDTFRSNQIREGQITRDRALDLVTEENRPRYQNIRWYLDALGMNYFDVISKLNRIPRLYSNAIELSYPYCINFE